MAKLQSAFDLKQAQLLARFEKDKTERADNSKYSELEKHADKTVVLPVQDLEIDDNCRKTLDTESIGFIQLMESIKKEGILQNLVVEIKRTPEFKLVCVSGQRRLLIAQMLKIPKVNCLIKLQTTSHDSLVRGLDENILRENLNPVDLAEAYLSLQNSGWSNDKISERYDKDPRTISRYISIAKFPNDAKKIIKNNLDKFNVRTLFNEFAKKKWNSDEDLLNAVRDFAFKSDKIKKEKTNKSKEEKIKKSLDSFYKLNPKVSNDMKIHIENALKYLKII